MRSFARSTPTRQIRATPPHLGAVAAALALAAAAPVLVVAGGLQPSGAQAASAAQAASGTQDVQALYTEALARERALRREMDLAPQMRAQPPGEASTALLARIRETVGRYESLMRRFPRSGYSDNALWQAAVLAADAFWQFGDTRDRTEALRLFDLLRAQYPTSSRMAQIEGHVMRLNGADGRTPGSTLKTIRREALPDALRITLELEREAMFHEERLDAPPRVFIDLRNTQPVEALKDATVPFPDDVVRQARIGRQADNRTRVVFDLDGAGRYSVYSLYNPYRIVIDFERAAVTDAKTAAATSETKDTRSVGPPAGAPGAKPVVTEAAPPPSPAAANSRGGFSLSRQLGLRISRVVIDPGHGGHDPGARVRGLNEAELVLDVALRLEKLLLKEPGVEVVLTRRTNGYVPLEERTAIANRAGADLFLSIHVNASASAGIRGFETYFLNFAPNPEAEALAARENAGSAKTMASLPDIVKAITLNNKLDESRDFAAMLQASMYERLRKVDRSARNLGVKQAPFMVLIGATMPSALAEISFVTNQEDAALLRSQAYRQHIAEALFAGIVKYQQTLKSSAAPVLRSGF
ncbi:MAG: N-acetylmuramoyl-L-alanine amidase [Acidobacteria bacterium]|nr:N-acetylmuramoyl-L-alanine amidase [Acidobacteriota bacterium]